MIKKSVRERNGTNITTKSSTKEVWSCIRDILNPESISKNSMKIETEDETIEDPLELAEKFLRRKLKN